MRIKNRLLLTFSVINLLVFTGVTIFLAVISEDSMETSLKKQLDNTAHIVKQQIISTINNTAEDYITATGNMALSTIKTAAAGMDEEAAKKQVIDIIKSIKVGESGYLYITDSENLIVYHPTEKAGKPLSVLKSWLNDNKKKSGIIHEYKYNNRDKKLYKIYFEEWDWQVFTSVYVDEFKNFLNRDTLNEQINQIKIGEGGYPIITDEKGLLLTHKSKNKIGVNVTKLKNAEGEYFLKDFFKKDSGAYNYNWVEPDDSVKYKYLNYIKEPITGWYIIVTAYWDDYTGEINDLKFLLVVISIIAMLINIASAIVSSNTIVRPIKELTNVIQEISEGDGDLTRKIAINRSDETGHMAGFLNNFVSNLNQMMGDIKESTDHTMAAKDDLSAVSEQTSTAIYQITKNIDHISEKVSHLDTNVCLSTDSVGEITGNINGLNRAIESQNAMIEESTAAITEMIASINSVAGITEKKQVTVENLVNTAKDGGKVIYHTQKSVNSVKEQLDNINEMTNLISGIAARTNLLAMNAAIEAAHAGDAGKGFAVVADEIRKLAESSSNSSAKIKETIQNVSAAINETSEYSEKTGESFDSIDKEIQEVVLALNEIIASTGELQIGGQELLTSINSLRDISSDVRDNSISIKESAENVNTAMDNTSKITLEVVTAIKEVNLGTTEIQKSMGSVTDNIQLISKTGNKLSDNVNKFKIEV